MTGPGRESVRRTRLASGLTVVTQELPTSRTAAVTLVQRHGSRDEDAADNGLAHFLEHFVFRGTAAGAGRPARTAWDIAAETDLLGGGVDAFTEREIVAFGAEVPSELLPRAVGLLADLVARPVLPAADLERELAVVREEIKGYEDSPEDVVSDLSFATCWPDHPLGRPILGTLESLDEVTLERVLAFWRDGARCEGLVVCAAGPQGHDEVLELVERGLGELPPGRRAPGPAAPPPARCLRVERRGHLEQAHLVLTLAGLPLGHPDEPVLDVVATALGGGMSSRLWQRIREEEGLAYDVSLAAMGCRELGRLEFHAATSPENVLRTLTIFNEEVARVAAGGLRPDEHDRALQGLKASLIVDGDGAGSCVDQLVDAEIVHGRPVSLEERLAWLGAVTPDRVRAVGARLLGDRSRTLTVLGPADLPRIPDAAVGPGASARGRP